MKRPATLLVLAVLIAGAASGQERFRRTEPRAEPHTPLVLPAIESEVLGNGLRVTVARWTAAPLMAIQLILNAGESRSPDRLPGLATCAANLFLRGTRVRTAPDIEDFVESLGGRLSLNVTQDQVFITLQFPEEALDKAFGLLIQMILQPNWTEGELANVKRTLAYDLQERERDPEFAARRHLIRVLFQKHPYAKYSFTRDAIKAWTLRDVADFIDRTYRPNNAQLIITGDIDRASGVRKAAHFLTAWQARGIPAVPLPLPRPPERDWIGFLDVPQASACSILAAAVFPPLEPKGRAALGVLNQVLGGSANSRLFMNLREKNGFAFFAYSEAVFFKAGGLFLARALVTPDNLAPAVREILGVLRAPLRTPFEAEEIEPAKSNLIGSFPLHLARLEDYIGRVGSIQSIGWGDEAWNDFQRQIMMVGPDAVAQTASLVLAPPLTIIMAGDLKVCTERFSGLDSVDVFDSKGKFQYIVKPNPKESR